MSRLGLACSAILPLLLACTPDAADEPTVDLGLTAESAVHLRTSYAYGQAHARCANRFATGAGSGKFLSAFAWMDLDGDGDDDQLAAPGGYTMDGVGSNTPFDARLFTAGAWTFSPGVFSGGGAESMHPRKMLTGDLNGDGDLDAVVIDHGYDAAPFPGAPLRILLSDGAGHLVTTVRTDLTQYSHGGALGDLDHDGDLDLFVGANSGSDDHHLVLLNDGAGVFTEAAGRFPLGAQIFTVEIFDLDGDGFLDVATGGNEFDGSVTRVRWGSSRGSYRDSLSAAIPQVPGYGVILDFDAEDLDGDGDRDLVVLRSGGGAGGPGFYQGWAIQILVNQGGRQLAVESATRLDAASSTTERWADWLFVFDEDGDGDVDLCSDVWGEVRRWRNDGEGVFSRQ